MVQGVARRDAVAIFRRYVKTGVFHAQWREDAPFEEGIEPLTGYPPENCALNLLLKAVAEQGTGLCFQWELGQFGDDVVVCAAPKIGRGVHLIHLGVGAAQRRTEGEARRGRHQMAHGHRTIERHQLAILQHLQIGELGNELRDGIVELPLAFFIEEQHCDGDDRFGHRGDAEDGVFSQRFSPPNA